jgi:hypothetical protein
MRTRSIWAAKAWLGPAAAAIVALAPACAGAAEPAPKEIAAQLAQPTVKAPRLRDGQPDFQGTWNRYPDLLISPFLPGQPKPGDPQATPQRQPQPQLKPQYKAILDQRWKRVAEAAARNQPIAEKSVSCIPDGMPNMMRGAWIMEIVQTPEQINISQELYNQTRRVYMKQKMPPLADLDPGYFGRSMGHFEGQELVIETIGTREDIMASSGAPGSSGGGDVPHSANMKIVERIRYIAPDLIQDDLTMIDPETLEAPWSWAVTYKKMPADYKMQEYVCEANREAYDANGVQRRTDAEAPPANGAK